MQVGSSATATMLLLTSTSPVLRFTQPLMARLFVIAVAKLASPPEASVLGVAIMSMTLESVPSAVS